MIKKQTDPQKLTIPGKIIIRWKNMETKIWFLKREREKKSMPDYENGKYDSWKREKKKFDARKWKLKYDYRIAFSD